MQIKHTFQSAKSDGGDATLVRPSNWNANHTIVDPIEEAFGAADTTFTFDSSDLSALTIFGSADSADANTTIPGHLYLSDNDGAFTGYTIAASPAFTAVMTVTDYILEQDYQWIGLAHGNSGFTSYVWGGIRYDSGRGARGIRIPSDVQFGPTQTSYVFGGSPFYVAIRAASSTDVSMYYSRSGRLWFPIIVGDNPGFTVARVGILVGTFGSAPRVAAAIDDFRIWNSAKTFAT